MKLSVHLYYGCDSSSVSEETTELVSLIPVVSRSNVSIVRHDEVVLPLLIFQVRHNGTLEGLGDLRKTSSL